MFSAGSDTSATVLQWAMAEMMQEAQEEVRRELAGHDRVTEDGLTNLRYLRLVIEETLRLHPPAPLLMPRECGSPCQVVGYDVPLPTGRDGARERAGHRQGPGTLGRAGGVRPREVSASLQGFQGDRLRDHTLRRRKESLPRHGVRHTAHVELALAALLFHFEWKLPDGMVPEEMDMTGEAWITTRRRSDLLVFAVPRVPVPTE
jgi:hypothetical protein